LELPIDHFRLLGVGPSTDAQSVLHSLQQRLTRPPDEGFSQDTLEAREQLLRASADLLSDEQRRASYEAALTALNASSDPVMPALDVPSPREVAGLLLLLEAVPQLLRKLLLVLIKSLYMLVIDLHKLKEVYNKVDNKLQ
jgi:hypothetical protein